MARPLRLACAACLPVAGLAAALTATGAAAQAQGTVFAGGAFGADRTAYAGVAAPVPGSRIGHGWAVRAIVSATEYDYRSGGTKISGEEVRAELSALLQRSGSWGYIDAGLGARYVDIRLSPADPGNPRRGDHWDAAVSVSGEGIADPWRVTGFAAYGLDFEDYYVRADVTRAVTPSVRLGVEAVANGDPAYDQQRLGAVVAYAPGSDWEIQFAVGASESNARDGAYGAVGFRRTF